MIVFGTNTIPLVNALLVLIQFALKADLNCSPAMVSIVSSPISGRFTAALRLAPKFFIYFPGTRNYRLCIYADAFYRIIFNMLTRGYSRMVLDYNPRVDEHHILLLFRSLMRSSEEPLPSGLVVFPSENQVVAEIDYRYFFSIDAEKFVHVVTELHFYFDTIHVTMTDSQVRFAVGVDEVVLTKEQNECIIGRIGTDEETHFQIYLNPKLFFYLLSRRSKRVWFFKSIDPPVGTIIAAPISLYAQMWVYFPHDFQD